MGRVVILGGGVGGLSVAHELAERGDEVVVLERRHNIGGKARSIQVEPTRLGGDPHRLHPTAAWAPGEHGFRFFPGFYRHVIDTMARIPRADGGAVVDCLVPTSRLGITQYDRPMFEFPTRFPRKPNDAVTVLQAILMAFSPVTGLRPAELAHFGARIWQILTSCPERRLAEYEKIPWWTFIAAERHSTAYKSFLASGITRSLVAAKAKTASTRTIGDIFVQLVLTMIDPVAGSADRVLEGPTSRVWIDEWESWITSLGVDYRTGVTITGIRCDGERITGVVVEQAGQTEVVVGDHYVCALPVERTAPLLTPAILEADPGLATLETLAGNVESMNGLQFYLRRDLPVLHGHVIHIDTEWALTSISQLQFWRPDALDPYSGCAEIRDILSVDVSDWEQPGLSGRRAMDCTRQQVASEVWEQLKRSMNHSGVDTLKDEDVVAWFLDPDIRPDPMTSGRLMNVEPLLVNLADTWRLRPEAVTAIPNFFLASDYVRTYTDLATMEGANEAGRRAANGILDATGYGGERCLLWPLEEPTALAPFREYDAARFKLGLAWDSALVDMARSGLAAVPGLGDLPSLLSGVEPFITDIEQVKLGLDQVERAVHLERVEEALLEPVEQLHELASPALATTVPLTAPSTVPDRGPEPAVVREPQMTAVDGAVPTLDDGPEPFADRLTWYRHMITDVLARAVPEKEPYKYLYGPMREFVDRPAKGLRPALCLATCRSYGGAVDDAVVSAAGLELLHQAFLVHDDIEDGSSIRRGGTTLHRQFGEPVAINVGDSLNAYAMRVFRGNVDTLGPQKSFSILDEIDHLVVETLEGQAIELGWVRDKNCDVGVDDYLRMVLKKTAWYSFIHPMRIGALVAGAGGDLDRFNRFGFLLGAAFQIRDDVLNLTGDVGRYGKEIGGDLWEGKRTLVLSHALAHVEPADHARLVDFLGRPRQSRLPREVNAVYDVLVKTGAIEWARTASSTLIDAARQELSVAFQGAHDGHDLGFIRSLVDYMIDRDA